MKLVATLMTPPMPVWADSAALDAVRLLSCGRRPMGGAGPCNGTPPVGQRLERPALWASVRLAECQHLMHATMRSHTLNQLNS